MSIGYKGSLHMRLMGFFFLKWRFNQTNP